MLVSALVKRYNGDGEFVGEPESRRLVAQVLDAFLVPECPECGRVMVRLVSDMDLRDCGGCRVRARLNEEEVAWLISEARSTQRLRQTERSSAT